MAQSNQEKILEATKDKQTEHDESVLNPVYKNESDLSRKEKRQLEKEKLDKEKQKIKATAKKCGISTTEYVRQRALGYEPKTVPPDALFVLLEKSGD